MNNTTLISKALNDPYLLTDTEKNKVSDLLQSFPYFVPARHAKTANNYQQDTSASVLYHTKELYTTNWLLFNEYLQLTPQEQSTSVGKESEPEKEKQAEENTEMPKEETPKPQNTEPKKEEAAAPQSEETEQEELIKPVYSEDYFLHQGVKITDDIPEDLDNAKKATEADDPKSLMVMMSFAEWLLYFKKKKQQEAEEEQEKKALRTLWQKEKLAAAMEEEGDEIPEDVFKMAVDSISKEDNLVSESLAEIHYKQGRHDKAIDMYRKLSLRNPGKKVYFARKIEEILKNK